jgi:hypothetical protein
MALYIGLYYRNVWNALNFPSLSQQLFSQASNSTLYAVCNQSAILDINNELDPAALATTGLPSFATTNVAYLLTTNIDLTATFIHVLLWNREAITEAFSRPDFSKIKNLRPSLKFWQKSPQSQGIMTFENKDTSDLDPHYQKKLFYEEFPAR